MAVDIDDSFAENLVQSVGEVVRDEAWPAVPSGGEVVVRRTDAVDLAGVDALDPDAVVVSRGPGTPAEAGVSIPLFAPRSYPTLGVRLGHQAICAAKGAPLGHAPAVVHGKGSTVRYDGEGTFRGRPGQFDVDWYHSLPVESPGLPDELPETATTDREAGIVMAVRHADRPRVGVQFHPERIRTTGGKRLIANFPAAPAA
jgi:anthranilate synthase component 2